MASAFSYTKRWKVTEANTFRRTYGAGSIAVWDFQLFDTLENLLNRHEHVLEDQLAESLLVFVGVTSAVDNSHLFDESRFARFTAAQQQQLELLPGIAFIFFQLLLYLLIDSLLFLRLFRQTAFHHRTFLREISANEHELRKLLTSEQFVRIDGASVAERMPRKVLAAVFVRRLTELETLHT